MKIFLDTIGCRLNQSEIESFALQFRAAGHKLVPIPQEADLVVINTCAVTAAAASDSRQKIRQIEKAGANEIVVTGCWSTINPLEAKLLPGVVRVVDNAQKDSLVADLLQIQTETFSQERTRREPIPGRRARTRAFIKVQDGCDNRCTFCITTIARGPSRSRSINDILADIQFSLEGGSKEIVLTGVHLGSWGQDFSPRRRLHDLIEIILARTAIPRLRLSSLEGWDIDKSFFSLWEDRRLCRHLHLPLQSGCKETLRRMARKTTPHSFANLVAAARYLIPEVAITTDVIVGFPGEDEAEFTASIHFIREMQFAGGHVFTYSARPGTAAARLVNQVGFTVRKERNERIRSLLAESAQTYRSRFCGKTLATLWEGATHLNQNNWQLTGRTDNFLSVRSRANRNLWNQITPVILTEAAVNGFEGVIIEDGVEAEG